jgi:hypothetical protein
MKEDTVGEFTAPIRLIALIDNPQSSASARKDNFAAPSVIET